MASFPDLHGRVVLVTGASSGLGARFARVLAAEGARVAAAGRRVQRLRDLAAELNGAGASLLPVEMDVTDTDTIAPALRMVEAAYGPVQVLVNNAGIGHQAKLTEVTPAEYDAVFATNLRGAFFTAQACARHMIERQIEGRIINIASVAGIRPIPQLAVYGMTKAALIHMTRAMAREWARHGINVNAICPGYIETELNRDFFASPGGERLIETLPRRRLGQPEDLDGVIKLLASRESRIVNGAVITADDGYTAG